MTDERIPLGINGQNLSSLEGVLRIFKNNIFTTLNVCMPCKVISYNATDNTVDLQPSIQTVLANNERKDRAILTDVPVISLGGNGLTIRIPLKKGDTGIVIFCDRDITLYKEILDNSKPLSTSPQTLRKHDIADGIFIPSTFSKISTDKTSDIVIQNDSGSVQFVISSTGITVKGNITVDGDVIASGISLKNHTHSAGSYSNSGGSVSGTSGTPQ